MQTTHSNVAAMNSLITFLQFHETGLIRQFKTQGE